ncbi:MAG: hypothetical protein J1F28_10390 [Oscillospiraceae bacterium]|nr:hypothetical protein [Oscillospiraceae bacterium]
MIDNDALMKYKIHLCRRFLEGLLQDKLITQEQMKKIEKAFIKRIIA